MTDLTATFRSLVQKHQQASSHDSAQTVRKRKRHPGLVPTEDEYMKEARRIYAHISDLRNFLLSVRQAYLNISTASSRSHRGNGTSVSALRPGAGVSEIRHLTDKERDEIDYEVRMILTQSWERVRRLEEAEQVRRTALENRLGFVSRWLRDPTEEDMNDLLSAHRSGVTWFLNQKLAKVSGMQKEQQEIRVMRQVEKSKSMLHATPVFATQHRNSPGPTLPPADDTTAKELEALLTPQQLQALESENKSMLEEFSSTLDQVRGLEKALMEISSLQNVLVQHLVQQTELTDQLYDEAVTTAEEVQRGNTQLKKARERNSSTTKFILVFLIMASLILLFLDWYS
ncbi:hypothetical protein SAICODRAFT_66730 [Saitoella complicata NRRL Y-17804]|uniref:SNARE-complex protein Syntaxin-18 N-terminal domain-containing protein n=1 Tax=Saitoella complicata (strain BCRC 22490 / CBS 7301 / JCM 7358 / NBRC 10748 / NRRL Y-17804) TaxID=698492 RepID=A0A0E9NL61_SAICN|nr:uncharacterized protein SAICODRAFT_66730 [Saitoella complicata NRRL Y-17804]ODQ51759.1 hypothetical protein SAICODRAFT_66730 [Saitoella complicata NRRL Y-17804]GAO50622.1 hypothetical protein G7K_4746-t1 [Saitoella complicata NRRL Y-17804]